MSKRTVLSGLAAALGASAVLLAGMPGSASAAEVGIRAEGRQFKNVQTGLCLDSDAKGNAYTKSCGNDNLYQRWSWDGNDYNGYKLKNNATNRCLQVGNGDAVRTEPCFTVPRASQLWKWNELDGGRLILKSTANDRALDSNAKGQLYTSPYGTGNLYMQWWQW
ncbi:RICIN domain-containing protein [Streptomyces chrestomyceticus]|uniref:RICIN domain-containing protein n=1 Tax=Streptomyces chrestomyceticus TaxID=68185 RepID=UPI0033EFD732